MKKIILFFIICALNIVSVFAETNIILNDIKNNIEVWEWFPLQIEITSDEQTNVEILEITWVENFQNLWRSQSHQIENINWVSSSKIILEFILRADESGEYFLWPVKIKIWKNIIESNNIKVNVIENKQIIIWNKKSEVEGNEESKYELNEKEKKEAEDENDKIIEEKKEVTNLKSYEKQTEKISDMQDIHDVKNLNITLDKIKYNLVIKLLLLIVWVYILYLILNKLLELNNNRKKKKLDEQNKLEYIKKEKENIYQDILNLSEDMEDIWKDVFYADLNYLFRRYFVYLWVNNAYNMTLKELQNQKIENKIFDIFSKSYMYEFSLEEDSISKRKQIVMNFMIYLKK